MSNSTLPRRFERPFVAELRRRLEGASPHLQVVLGPRQVGKTSGVEQVLERWKGPTHYASADLPAPPDANWLQTQWLVARQRANGRQRALLALDEVQKVPRWAEVVKAMHDEDRRLKARLRVVLLGSSSLHVGKGATESLAGRFEVQFCPHWTWPDCRAAFGWSLDEWLFWGGYPGAATLTQEPSRWRRFIADSLVEAVLSRDVLMMGAVAKPALLRQLFMLAVRTPAQALSFNKMLGQLQDAGNTTTLASYLDLLQAAFMVSGLGRWSAGALRARASSPKLVIWNNAIISALSGFAPAELHGRSDLAGRWVENAVGAHLLNHGLDRSTWYWSEGEAEVDYVVEHGGTATALEVKSGRRSGSAGVEAFRRAHPKVRVLSIGTGGVPLEDFFAGPPQRWL
ncbi:MAG: ATP-binding protein [Archangiaceae bacterium]|nr:ATP-binding protein [Archangiaceae bacterium]